MNNEEKEQRFKMIGMLTLKTKPGSPAEGNLSLTGKNDIAEISSTTKDVPDVTTDLEPIIENGNEEVVNGISQHTFWHLAARKLAENFLSVKVWTIFVLMYISAWLCFDGKMTGAEFATLNAGVISTVYGLREAFKVEKIRKMTKADAEDVQP
jgi:hypothetical protein